MRELAPDHNNPPADQRLALKLQPAVDHGMETYRAELEDQGQYIDDAVRIGIAAAIDHALSLPGDEDLPMVPMRHEYPAGPIDDQGYHDAMVAWVRQVCGQPRSAT